MDNLVLEDGWTLSALEEALRLIEASGDSVLQVSKDFVSRRKGALHDAARLQVFATWARRASKRPLRFHAANSMTAVLDELCEYAPGITALRLCDGVAVGDELVRRREALEPAVQKMVHTDNLILGQIVKGRTIDFSCVSGSKVQYLRPLFSVRNSKAVKRKEGMFYVLKTLSDFVAKHDADLVPTAVLDACAVFASELLKNTQEHATRDHDGHPYVEHVEGLIVSWQELEDESYRSDFSGHPLLKSFWEREIVSVQGGAGKALRCLQLSFFDTGPGFAARLTGQDTRSLSLEEERTALLKCLTKNASTKNETGAGNGIPDVLEALQDVGGLMSIRSGRLNIFNAFVPSDDRSPFEFEDWTPAELAPVVGAVVSLLIPLRR